MRADIHGHVRQPGLPQASIRNCGPPSESRAGRPVNGKLPQIPRRTIAEDRSVGRVQVKWPSLRDSSQLLWAGWRGGAVESRIMRFPETMIWVGSLDPVEASSTLETINWAAVMAISRSGSV